MSIPSTASMERILSLPQILPTCNLTYPFHALLQTTERSSLRHSNLTMTMTFTLIVP